MIHCRHRRLELRLRHTFRLARGAIDRCHNVLLELEHDGLIGLGEAAPTERCGQGWESVARAAQDLARRLEDPRVLETVASAGVQPAAAAAIDMALRDLAGKRLGAPLYELLGIDRQATPPTSFTIGMDSPEAMAAKVGEAGEFEVLKIKLGSEGDRELLEAVRAVSHQRLRVDANEGWTMAGALARLEWLQKLGVELVEQPLPAGQLEATRELRRHSPLPFIADESVHRAADIPSLVGAFDGINIKLMKCGGIGEALRMIAVARAHGMRIMLGCMVESSLAITAAAHLSPLVDYADLDGNLLLAKDPFVGVEVHGGRLVLPQQAGLGVRHRQPPPEATQAHPC